MFHVADQPRVLDEAFYTDPDDSFVPVIESIFLWVQPAIAVTDLIVNGTLARHPGLRIGIVELSSIWVPQYLMMLDGGWDFTTALNGRPLAPLELRPSEYFHRQVRVSSFSYEQPARLTAKSGDLFMCCSDFPHSEGTATPIEDYARIGCLPDQAARAVPRQRRHPPGELTSTLRDGRHSPITCPMRRSKPMCAWWVRGTPGSSAALRAPQGGKSVVVLEARDRVGGRIWTEHLLRRHGGRPRRCVAGPETRRHVRAGPRLRRVDLQDLGRKAPTSSSTTVACCATGGSSPRSAPSPWLTIALAQARLDWTSKRVPLDAPWTAKRASDWDSRSVASWFERSGIRTTVGRETSSTWRCAACSPATLDETSYLHLLFLVRAHGSINTLFSIKGGSQENMMEGGAGLIAQRMAESLGDAVRLAAARPLHHPTRRTTSRSHAADVSVSARHAVVCVPPALALDIAFDPALPEDRRALYSERRRRSRVEDPRRLRRALLAGRRLQRPERRARLGRRGHPRCLAGVGDSPASSPRSPSALWPSASPSSTRASDGVPSSTRSRPGSGPGPRLRSSSSRRRGGPSSGRAAARWRTSLPDSSPDYGPLLRQPFGRVHWAGTETSTRSHGAIDGAVRSGQRAAAEILDRT